VHRALFVVALIACKPGVEAGRVEVEREDGMVVLRDSMHVLELRFARSTTMIDFGAIELPEIEYPGRVALADSKGERALAFWITRLGPKRPANIQRWFDDKLSPTRLHATVISDHGAMFGEHPARLSDFVLHAKDHDAYERWVGVDVPEHDLEVVVLAWTNASTPTPEQQQWLDHVADDVRELKVSPKPAAP
jgi:hypothetical protein